MHVIDHRYLSGIVATYINRSYQCYIDDDGQTEHVETQPLKCFSCVLFILFATVDPERRSALYVRSCYGQLFDIITERKHVLVTGTPGIGKVYL